MAVFRSELWAPILIIYYLLHVLIRTSLGAPLTPDEAEIFDLAQSFQWTYDEMMPLYPWLQFLFFKIFGPTVLALALLKNLILLTTCILVNRLVWRVAGPHWAWIATLSLAFLPQIIWKSQHSMTDAVLATCLAVALAYVVVVLRQRPSATKYAALGIVCGLGLITTFVFAWVIVAAAIAAFSSAAFRPILVNRSVAISIALAVIICVTPAWNAMHQFVFAMPSLPSGFSLDSQVILNRARQAYSLLQTGVAFTAIFMIGVCFSVYKGIGSADKPEAPVVELREFLGRTIVAGVFMLLVVVVTTGTETAGIETIQPLMILAAPMAALYLYPLSGEQGRRNFVRLAAVIGAGILLLSPAYYSFGARTAAMMLPVDAPPVGAVTAPTSL